MKKYWEIFTDKYATTILHPQFIVFSLIRNEMLAQKKYIKNKSVIDIGCGRMPYKKIFQSEYKKYTGLDHPQRPDFYKTKEEPDIFTDIIKKLPIKSNTYETALLTQVIEYLEKPEKTLKEIYRILKPNGFIILSTPFLYPIHDIPFDRNRFTNTQIKSLLENSGFKLIKIKALGNFTDFWLQSLNIKLLKEIMDTLSQKKTVISISYLLILVLITPPLIFISNIVFFLTKDIKRNHKNYFPIDYVVIATKA